MLADYSQARLTEWYEKTEFKECIEAKENNIGGCITASCRRNSLCGHKRQNS